MGQLFPDLVTIDELTFGDVGFATLHVPFEQNVNVFGALRTSLEQAAVLCHRELGQVA